MQHRFERERVEWKDESLSRLADLSAASEEIRQELEILGTDAVGEDQHEWIGDRVLLMADGEYLIYAFRHGANSGFVDHLFLARGSDDRWLYSTFHFCHNMAAIRADDPPASITEFAARYSAREFDGKSDACLQHTWPVKE